MHIPDGFLSGGVVIGTWAVAAGTVATALRLERHDPQPMPAGVLGATAAFVFAAQMINLPVAPATSGHLVGAALVATLLGPWRGVIVMAVVLAVQALLFQDGGLAALGANITDMGVGGVFAGFATASLLARRVPTPRGIVLGAVAGAFAATLVSATLTAIWLGLSNLYPLRGIVPLMLVTHAAIGVLEAALTGAVIATVARWRPDLLRGLGHGAGDRRPVAAAVGWLGLALVLAAFVSPFASALPDGLEHAAEALGFADRATSTWSAPFPDYLAPVGGPAAVATAVAGVAGTAATALLAWALSRGLRVTTGRGPHA